MNKFFNSFSRIIQNRRYRKYLTFKVMLKFMPRHKATKVKFEKFTFNIPDFASFFSAYVEIFMQGIYKFRSDSKNIVIIDVGANIGVSVAFFKSIFPKSHIVAIEADPKIFKYLQENILSNNFEHVELVNKAAWIEDGVLQFSSDGADGGKLIKSTENDSQKVDAINLASILEKYDKIDFLKIDIEGAENEVFPICRKYLTKVNYVFIEFHSRLNNEQRLNEILNILKDENFRVHISSPFYSYSPFMNLQTSSGFDNQLNIFGWRIQK